MKILYSAVLIMAVVALGMTSMPLDASQVDDRSESSGRLGIKEKSFEVSPFVGYNFFEERQNLENSLVYGGRLGFNFTKHFGIEGTVEFINSRVDDKSLTGAAEGRYRSPMDRVDISFYHIDAVYHFMPDRRWNPFVVAGFGGTHYSPKISNKDMNTLDLGVGSKYWLAEHIALRLDLRVNLVNEIFQQPVRDQYNYHNISATVGIVFAFGGKSKSTPVTVGKSDSEAMQKEIVLLSEMPLPQVEEKVKALASEQKIVILAFEDVHFDLNKSTLTDEAQTILKRNVKLLKNNPKCKVRIAGYTSASGTEEYNQSLSERRATAVKEYLIKEGVVTPDRLSTIGYGKAKPAEYEAAPRDLYSKAAKANMRVLFEIIIK